MEMLWAGTALPVREVVSWSRLERDALYACIKSRDLTSRLPGRLCTLNRIVKVEGGLVKTVLLLDLGPS
jgi:hypothetical protein